MDRLKFYIQYKSIYSGRFLYLHNFFHGVQNKNLAGKYFKDVADTRITGLKKHGITDFIIEKVE